ncbi:rRNA maturation RNase YbeY [Crocinitomix catalasitica]|nr:rRNA maturation RNase YbeY [Crocinitomix catalasitica]
MNNITYDFIDIEIPDFDSEFFSLWLNEVVKTNDAIIDSIGYVFCKDELLHVMNKEYLDHDYVTDIISFNYNDELSLNGEIFISWDRIQENANEFSKGDRREELCRVMVHGILHFLGYDDKSKDEKKRMRQKENESLDLRNSYT